MASVARILIKRGVANAAVMADEVDACVRAIVVGAESRLIPAFAPRVLANPMWQRLMARVRDDDRTVVGDDSDDSDGSHEDHLPRVVHVEI